MKVKSILKNSKFNFIFILILTGVVLFFSLKDNFLEVIKQLKTLNLFWIFIAFLLVIGHWFFSSLAMYLIGKKFNEKIKFFSVFRLNVVTQFFNGITPFASGGQPYQIYALKKQRMSLVDSTNISIETFVTYQLALITLGTVTIISNNIFNIFPDIPFLKLLVLIGFLVNLVVGLGLFTISFAEKFNRLILGKIVNLGSKLNLIKDKEKYIEKFNTSVKTFHDGAKNLLNDKKNFVRVVILQIVGLMIYYLVPLALLYSVGNYNSFNFGISIVATSYVMIIGAFVPLPGGTGGLEYSFLAFFGNFVSGSTLTTLMIMWRFCTYYFGMILGAILFNLHGGKKDENRYIY